MKRTRIKQTKRPDAILTADLHLSESTPISRTDDYLEAQKKKLLFLQDLQKQHGCPVIDAGDIFNHWKPSPWLLERAFRYLPEDMITIPGNHDLPEHSMKQYHKSGLFLLDVHSENVMVLHPNDEEDEFVGAPPFGIYGFPYGEYEDRYELQLPQNTERLVLILHEMVWPKGQQPWPGAEGYAAEQILKDNPNCDLIVTGHHHKAFVVQRENQILVNPGPMMRISADKADYKPRCYLYFSDDNSVEAVFFPIESNVHDTSYIDQVKERNERLEAYIARMNMEWESGLSFQGNLEMFFKRNKTPKKVRELIYENLEE